jgi:3-methyladenine DNA glycosylase AlkD
MRFLGYELIAEHPAARARLNARLIERLGRELGDWGMVDAFGCAITGPAWREGQLSDGMIKRWARSPDRWRRRLALVSTVPLNVKARGGFGDAPRTVAICTLLVDDRDDMVVKALSWALRSLARRDPVAVRRFLARHDSRLPARVRREVGNLLRTGRKS